MPRVSVLMPVYKTKEEYLREAIESTLNQTFKDFELILIDDCPTDKKSQKIIESYKDKRIRYYRNDKNLGISDTRNRLISLAKGEFFAVLDHDDVCMPTRFEKQVAFFDEHPEVGVVGSITEQFPKKKICPNPTEHDDIEKMLFFHCAFTHSAVMVRKKVIKDNHLMYEKAFFLSEDYALWTRLVGKTKFANLPDVLLRYRKHGTNTSLLLRDKMETSAALVRATLRSAFPEKWAVIQSILVCEQNVRFLGIPFLKIRKKLNRTKIVLFGFIPILSIKSKYKM